MRISRTLGIGILFLSALACKAQLSIPLGGNSPDNNKKPTRITSRTLTGMVLDKSSKPIAEAVVYLKNTKTLAVKTYIAQNDGTYRFPELSLSADYEVYAEKDGKKSKVKTVSQFDDREKPNINLQIDTGQ